MDQELIEQTFVRLEKHDQQHLIGFVDQLNPHQKADLVSQIRAIDLEKVDQWIDRYIKSDAPHPIPAQFSPAPSFSPQAQGLEELARYQQAAQLGERLISQGRVGAFVVAGGQGTRLGFDGPKGNFPISPIKNKTLFQLFGESIAAASRKYGVVCPWYVMTSPQNYRQTVDIFQENDHFGLGSDNVFIFQQGTLPNFAFDGKIILQAPDRIACSPDGHGGSLKALFDSGALSHMQTRGIEHISYWQVDNPLINIIDPLFVGLHALEEAQMSSKAILKSGPFEKVGNFCLVDGKVTVVEYSDLPDELAQRKDDDGSLLFELGSIGIHMVDRSFVERLNDGGFSLPFHRAIKKIPFVNASGDPVEPTEPNGIKLETFVFDAIPLASKSIILQTIRSEEFGPIKNATGIDSAETARQMLIDRAAAWLEKAGVVVPRTADGAVNCTLEIAPGFALCPEDVKAKSDQISKIRPGDSIYLA